MTGTVRGTLLDASASIQKTEQQLSETTYLLPFVLGRQVKMSVCLSISDAFQNFLFHFNLFEVNG